MHSKLGVLPTCWNSCEIQTVVYIISTPITYSNHKHAVINNFKPCNLQTLIKIVKTGLENNHLNHNSFKFLSNTKQTTAHLTRYLVLCVLSAYDYNFNNSLSPRVCINLYYLEFCMQKPF